MTIKNNLLGDKLTNFKNKKDSSKEEIPQNFSKQNIIRDLIDSLVILFVFFFKSFIFGYTAKLIFSTEWVFLDMMIVGLTFNFILQFIDSLFHR